MITKELLLVHGFSLDTFRTGSFWVKYLDEECLYQLDEDFSNVKYFDGFVVYNLTPVEFIEALNTNT